jgi:hypothetical protein
MHKEREIRKICIKNAKIKERTEKQGQNGLKI